MAFELWSSVNSYFLALFLCFLASCIGLEAGIDTGEISKTFDQPVAILLGTVPGPVTGPDTAGNALVAADSVNHHFAVGGPHDSDTEYSLELTNDGPVIQGSQANFVATLTIHHGPGPGERARERREKNMFSESKFFYYWSGDSQYLPQDVWDGPVCRIAIPFEDLTGEMDVNVTVWTTSFFTRKLAEANSAILVTEYINGQIMMNSTSYPECNMTDAPCSIPTRSNVTLQAAIHDPGKYFQGADILYRWNMSNGVIIESKSPILVYRYLSSGSFNITVNLTAKLEGGVVKSGFWHRNITVLDTLTNLTIESCSTSVLVGKREVVNVTCNGSLPVEVCVTVQEPSINATNRTCKTISRGKCFTSLTYNFHKSGEYVFLVSAENNVSFLHNVSSIHAHEPSLPAQSITAITLAVMAGILMTCIGVVVFLQQIQQNRRQHVEVANFDFQFRDRSFSSSYGQKSRGFGWNTWDKARKSFPLFNSKNSYYDEL